MAALYGLAPSVVFVRSITGPVHEAVRDRPGGISGILGDRTIQVRAPTSRRS